MQGSWFLNAGIYIYIIEFWRYQNDCDELPKAEDIPTQLDRKD